MRWIFTLAVLVNSALLFLVQPMVGKMILPRFGGVPSVWNTTMLFFQAALLGGYAYAHFSVKWLGPKRQSILHLALLSLGFLLLPITLPAGVGAEGANNPAFQVLATLLVMVGLPFLLVSAGAPLLQRWFAQTDDPLAESPYFLYAASNFGSLASLLAYPFLMEPSLTVQGQTSAWRLIFVALIVLLAVCAGFTWKRGRDVMPGLELAAAQPLTWADRGKWILLSAVPVSLLLGCTTFVTTSVAPIPLLWVIPLCLYLVSFILAFARKPILKSSTVAWFAIPLAGAAMVTVNLLTIQFFEYQLIANFGALLAVAWMCHAVLVENKPHPTHLTEFYLWLSFGGVVGGAFNSLLSPVIFTNLYEYPIALAVAIAIAPRVVRNSKVWVSVGLGLAFAAMSYGLLRMNFAGGEARWGYFWPPTLIVVGIPMVLALIFIRRPLGIAISFLLCWAVGWFGHISYGGNPDIAEFRSYFGTHSVNLIQYGGHRYHAMRHGNTLHGMQDLDQPRRTVTYYMETSGIGLVMKATQGTPAGRELCVLGLGTGMMATFSTKDRNITFYEIDPEVVTMAKDTRLFTYLKDAPGKVDLVMGDARLEMQRAPNGKYGVMMFDAFTSDAIPVHLVTKEAIRIYLQKLAPNGIMVFHISNRYVELEPVLAAAAEDLGLKARIRHDLVKSSDTFTQPGKNSSDFVIMARSDDDLKAIDAQGLWERPNRQPGIQAWTDDRSDILSVFRFSRVTGMGRGSGR
ncbi:MAG: fused MFS/spermidine synthase [Armatimonadetes bacterium]|nr:fused MFS/spermidine synthase [Armatimonadota bacterium]